MLRGVWQALNSLSIRVTYTAIVPGAYTGEAKMCKKCAKMANFQTSGLNYWETVEDRWVYTARHFTSIESAFQPCDILRLSQGRTQGRPKCAKNVLKWQTFRLQAWIYWETVEDRWIYTARRFTSIESSFQPFIVTFTAIVPGATPYGGVKCKGGRKKLRFATNIWL